MNLPLDDNAKALRRRVYSRSPYLLGKEVLGYSRFCETQTEWSDWYTKYFHSNPQNRQFALKMAPRGVFKSTFFVVTCTIFDLINNPNLTILIASETATNAEAHLAEIKKKLESPAFRSIFGDWTSGFTWRNDAITIRHRKLFSKEASIETAGIEKAITGKHYDKIICDDVVGMLDRDSEAKRKLTFNFCNGLFDVLKKEQGQLLYTGTHWHREDYYFHIENKLAPAAVKTETTPWIISKVPARAGGQPEGKLEYPRLLSEKRLLEIRTVKQGKDGIDISTFMAQYMLNPMAPEEQIFKTFKFVDIKGVKYETFIQWTDPALSNKATACFAPTIVIAKVKDEPYWDCIYAAMLHQSPTEIIATHNRIYRMIRDMYQITGDVYMESNGFQLLLQQGAVDASAGDGDPVPTVGRPSTTNKEARIRSMEPFVSQGFLRFREDFDTAPENYCILLEQLQNFPQGKIDGPDALQCAHSYTQLGFSCRTILPDGSQQNGGPVALDDTDIFARKNPNRKEMDIFAGMDA